MKIRNGFVSNSSSSSFLIVLPEYPYSIEKLEEMLFGKKQLLTRAFTENFKTKDCASVLYKKMMESNPITFGKIFDEMRDITYQKTAMEPYFEFDSEQEEEIEQKIRDLAFKMTCEFSDKHKKGWVYLIEISDHDGPIHSFLEHNDEEVFKKIDYIKKSNH